MTKDWKVSPSVIIIDPMVIEFLKGQCEQTLTEFIKNNQEKEVQDFTIAIGEFTMNEDGAGGLC